MKRFSSLDEVKTSMVGMNVKTGKVRFEKEAKRVKRKL